MSSAILTGAARATSIRICGRPAFLASAATLSLAIASAAQAQNQQTVYLPEGSTVGAVVVEEEGGRIVVDGASRLGSDGVLDVGPANGNPALVSGGVTLNGAGDQLWLRFTGATSTAMIEGGASVEGQEFTGGIVFEAAGEDSVLTLTAPATTGREMNETLRIGGDGTVVIADRINVSGTTPQTQALVVVPGSTSYAQGTGGDGRLDVILDQTISSNVIGTGLLDLALVDVRNAASFTITGNGRVAVGNGLAIDGGSSDILIEQLGSVTVRDATNAGRGVGILSRGGTITNRGTIDAVNTRDPAVSTRARGVWLRDGAEVFNEATGTLQASAEAVLSEGANLIVNHGLIASMYAPVILGQSGWGVDGTVVRNGASGRILAGTFPGGNNGNSTTAFQGGSGADVVVNAGTIQGDVLLGEGDDMFLVDGDASSVTGTVDGADGEDAYGRSFTASGTYVLDNAILSGPGIANFEYHGVEASGVDTIVTVTAGETLNSGIQMIGNGTVINEADITTDSIGIWARSHAAVPGRLDIVNRGNVVAEGHAFYSGKFDGTVRNDGTLSSVSNNAVYIEAGSDGEGYTFENNGTITASDRFDTFYGATNGAYPINLINSGSILQQGSGDFTSAAFNFAVRLYSVSGSIRLNNDGLIEATGEGNGAIILRGTDIVADNSGTIRGSGSGGSGLTVFADGAPGRTFSVSNSGTISANGGGHVEGNGIGLAYGLGVKLNNPGAEMQATNSGTIEATGTNSVALLVVGDDGGDQTFSFVNTGTIRGSGTDSTLGTGVTALETGLLYTYSALENTSSARVVASAIQTYNTVDDIENRGTIVGNVDLGSENDRFANYGTVDGDVRLGDGNDDYVYGLGSIVTGTVYGGSGFNRLLVDMSGDRNGKIHADDFQNFNELRRLEGTNGTGTLSLAGMFAGAIILHDMTIHVDEGDTLGSGAASGIVGNSGNEGVVNRGTINTSINLGGGDDRVENRGTIVGGISLGDGDDTIDNWGTITGGITLGDGNDRYIARAGSVVNGTVDGGAGNNTFIFQLGGGVIGEVPTNVLNFNSYGVYGPGTLDITLASGQDYQNLELLDGANLVVDSTGGTVGNIIGDDSAQHVTLGENVLTGGVSLGGGDDILDLTFSGVLTGALDGGAGDDTLNLTLTGDATINGMNGFETANIFGDSTLTLGGALGAGQRINFDGSDNELIITAGAVFEGIVNGGDGDDLLRIQSGASDNRTVVSSQIISFETLISEGTGTLALTGGEYSFADVTIDGGHLELGTATVINADILFTGTADNRFTLGANAAVNGVVDAGDGNDTMAFVTLANDVRVVDMTNFLNFENMAVSDAGEVRLGDYAFTGSIDLDGHLTVTGNASAAGGIIGGAGNDNLVVLGSFDGDVNLGDGNDRLGISSFDAITGTVDAGGGVNTLALYSNATYEAPTEFDGTGFDGFQNFEVASGVVSFTADTSWTRLDVTGGRLIGQVDTVLTVAEGITVAHGATFGSAGIVNADITVAGTLSPGASPGTMTVNGDVSFLAGSNLFLELTPEATDLLNISGVMTIAEGAAIDITGVLNGVPGNMLDLVVAEGGIQGRFTTVNKSETVFGFVVQNGNRLQLQSEFQKQDGFPTNVQASIDYSNLVLRSGYGVQAYTSALNVLTDAAGNIDQRAFAQLTPEAYGSAMQAGVDTGLSIVDSARLLVATAPSRPGFFGFAQGLLGGTDIEGQARTGSADADLRTTGFFGGVGYGFAAGTQVGAFIGKVANNQALASLGAETETDGFVAALFADAAFGNFGVHALVAHHGGEAETRRSILAASTDAESRYDLTSWVADLTARYTVEIGAGWAVAPKVGVTYVSTKRDSLAEDGAGAFALTVEEDSHSAWFADAGVAVAAALPVGGLGIRPYAEIGVRQMLSDGDVLVTGGYTGATTAPIVVAGTVRDKTVGRVGLGFGLDLSSTVRFHAGYNGEFSSTDRHNFIGGMSIRF